MSNELLKPDKAEQAIQAFESIEEGIELHDTLQAIVDLIKKRGVAYDNQIEWEDKCRRTERKIGDMFAGIRRAWGNQYALSDDKTKQNQLAEVGVSRDTGNRWEWEAKLTDEEYYKLKDDTVDEEEDLSAIRVMQHAKKLYGPPPEDTPPLPPNKYRCLVIDPPWPMQKIQRVERQQQTGHTDYGTMSIDSIAGLAIPQLYDEDGCHVYLWVTQKFLPTGLYLFKEWEVKYQCTMTWVKPTGMTPYSWMYNTEHVLFGRVGNLQLTRLGLKLSFEAAVVKGTHSSKPDVFFDRVVDASPGPRLNMFARRERDGFESWGTEA